MAKVGRSSRNASLMRVENVAAGTTKTIGDAETGEVYFLDGADDITITLPAHKAGAYFKFIVSGLLDGKTAVIQAADKTNAMYGQVLLQVNDMADAGDEAAADGSDDKVTLAASTAVGSWIECISDGSSWYVSGVTVGAAAVFVSTA